MKYVLALLALTLGLAAPARAAVNLYVQDSASPNCGMVSTANYKGYFQAASFSIGGTEPVTANGSTGSSAGKVSLSNLAVTKNVDNCSAALITEFLRGQNIPTLKLVEVESTGGNTFAVLSITLTNVMIASYNLSDSSGNGGAGTESITFKYERASITSTPVSSTGAPGTPVTVTYDITTNTVN